MLLVYFFMSNKVDLITIRMIFVNVMLHQQQ